MLLGALGTVASFAGCSSGEVDGTWRHPVDSEPTSGPAYELVLAQYGPEVAGLVRLFRAATEGGDAYARPVDCDWLSDGEVTGSVLRFRFRDPDGAEFSASLQIDGERLSGPVANDDGRVNNIKFERIDDDVDKDCEGRTEPFALHGIVQGEEFEGAVRDKLRVGLFYTGTEGGARFWVPRNVVPLDPGAPSFTITVHRQPDPKMLSVAPTDGNLRFAYALFIVFEDADGDGVWDREVLGAAPAERLVGVAPDHALAFLEGRGPAVFPDRPDLLEELAQNYNLVSIRRDADTGEITALRPADPAGANVLILPTEQASAPFLVGD